MRWGLRWANAEVTRGVWSRTVAVIYCGMKRLGWLAFLVGVGGVAPACATGPQDSLSGIWGQVGGGFTFYLRQSGSGVHGTYGYNGCLTAPVTGSVHGVDVQLTLGAGGSAQTLTGRFEDASTVILTAPPSNLDLGGFTIQKLPSGYATT
jgi:hypothetical protein